MSSQVIHNEPPKLQGRESEFSYEKYKSIKNEVIKDEKYNNFLKDKRVILVGPSPSLENSNAQEFIDSYDLVVRMNKGYPVEKEQTKHIGKRVDIHYHCLHEASNTGGKIFYEEMIKDNIYVSCPYPKYVLPFHSDVIRFESVNNNRLNFHWIDPQYYLKIATLLKTRPNSGIGTILDLLCYDIKELFIVGFTFFRDGWRKTYKDHTKIFGEIEGKKKEEEWLKGQFDGNHIQKPQEDLVREIYLNDSRVSIDNVMKDILNIKK